MLSNEQLYAELEEMKIQFAKDFAQQRKLLLEQRNLLFNLSTRANLIKNRFNQVMPGSSCDNQASQVSFNSEPITTELKNLENGVPNQQVLKETHLVFPRYYGEDPGQWICMAEAYFSFYRFPEQQKVLLAAYYMEGTAKVWFRKMELCGGFSSWLAFTDVLKLQFKLIQNQDMMERNQIRETFDEMEQVSISGTNSLHTILSYTPSCSRDYVSMGKISRNIKEIKVEDIAHKVFVKRLQRDLTSLDITMLPDKHNLKSHPMIVEWLVQVLYDLFFELIDLLSNVATRCLWKKGINLDWKLFLKDDLMTIEVKISLVVSGLIDNSCVQQSNNGWLIAWLPNMGFAKVMMFWWRTLLKGCEIVTNMVNIARNVWNIHVLVAAVAYWHCRGIYALLSCCIIAVFGGAIAVVLCFRVFCCCPEIWPVYVHVAREQKLVGWCFMALFIPWLLLGGFKGKHVNSMDFVL